MFQLQLHCTQLLLMSPTKVLLLGSSSVEEKWVESSKVPKSLIEEYEQEKASDVAIQKCSSNGMNVYTAVV